MNISKMASTVILATVFSTIFLFAIIFYLYGGGSDALRDALSMTAGFFGGIATLVAAYIATKLFNDWKEQHNKNLEKDAVYKILSTLELYHFPLMKLANELLEIRIGLSKGFTKFQYNMNLKKNPELKEKLKYSAKIIESFNGDSRISVLLEKYFEEFTLLENQTAYYVDIHNDMKKSMGLTEFDSPLLMYIVGNMDMLVPDSTSPVPYEKKYENYIKAFNSLSNYLISKPRA